MTIQSSGAQLGVTACLSQASWPPELASRSELQLYLLAEEISDADAH